jgi:catechol 2,3-dioxygenase-like lactoylglutathione lyase family enzyme
LTGPGVLAAVVSDEKMAKQWYVGNLGFEVQEDDELGRFFQHHAYYDMERAQPLAPYSPQDLV